MKQKKSSTNAAHAHAAADDHATQHPCYLTTFKGHEDTVVDLAFDHTGGTLATVCEDRIVRLYRCGELASRGPGASATFRRVPLPIAGGLAGVAFGRDASELVVMTAGVVCVLVVWCVCVHNGSVLLYDSHTCTSILYHHGNLQRT